MRKVGFCEETHLYFIPIPNILYVPAPHCDKYSRLSETPMEHGHF